MKYLLNISVAVVAVSALSGCGIDMYSPSTMTENQVQVSEEIITRDVLISDVDDKFIANLARHYTKHGGGDLEMVVTYDPKSRVNTAMTASNNAADIIGSLHGYGISDVSIGILPVRAQGSMSHFVVSYNSFNASAPKGCDVAMPGMNGELKGADLDYKLGCATKTILARQVAKPAHLLGRGATGASSEGRSAVNIVDGYRSGAQNEALGGQSATDD